MNYSVFIIVALIVTIIFYIKDNKKLYELNLSLYTKHGVTIEMGSFDVRRVDVTYFIKRSREKNFTTLDEQVDFLEKSLKASGYGTETFKEQEFKALVKDRGFEDVTLTARK